MPAERSFDAIVVGSGAAGGWAAKELTEGGLSVLALEAGPAVSPERDFPLPAPAERRVATSIARGLAGQSTQLRCHAFNARTRRFFVNDRDHPYTTPRGAPFNWFRGRQVGGRLHTWARVAVRMSPLEFAAASHDGHGVDWPLTYDDLAPSYDSVETFLGVHGSREGIATLPDGRYVEPLERTGEEVRFAAAVEAAFPDRRVVGARVVAHDPQRVPRTIRAARATGRLVLRPDAIVDRVTVDPATGRATGVSFLDRVTKHRHEFGADVVVLCAGTIDTLRILLNSTSRRHPGGLGNSSRRLGRGLMDHVMVRLAGPLPARDRVRGAAEADTDPYDFGRSTGIYVPRFRNTETADPRFVRGYTVQGSLGRGGPWWFLYGHGEMLARPDNAVTLDPRRRDAWGIPAARIACTYSENENAIAADAIATMREMAEAAGLQVRIPPSGRLVDAAAFRVARRHLLSASGAFLPGSAIHESGGAALGSDPAVSVLDPSGRCWDAPNVLVTDGACFPSGCSQNITLSIMALTVRACHHLLRDARDGRL